MYGASIEHLDLVAGGSPELAAAFQTVADTEVEGQPKFSQRVCRKLLHSVVCRAYAPAILELCHLITVAEACSRVARRYEEFFWASGPAASSGFRSFVDRELFGETETAPHFSADAQKVEIRYADDRFAITYARMPFLSALCEFLVTVLGYGALDELWQDMLASGPTAASVSEAANRLSRLVYGYLKDHLPTAQSHRKLAGLVAYLLERGEGDFGLAAIEDEAVLDFWLAKSAGSGAETSDFRTFASVFRAFVRLRQVVEEARDHQAIAAARRIGHDQEAGEVDPDSVVTLVESVEEAESPLEVLQRPPAKAVKFLNKTEAGELAALVECGRTSFALPLSLLRCAVFGTVQARISQAQRRKLAPEALRAMIEAPAPSDYLDRQDRLVQLCKHLDRVLLASLEVLAAARRPEAVSVVTALRPDLDLAPLARLLLTPRDDGKVVPLLGEAFRDRLSAALAAPETVGPELAALMTEAGKALKGLSRQGFSAAEAADPEIAESFAVGTEAVIEVRQLVADFRGKLQRMRLPEGDWALQFAEDSLAFRRQFLLLYGVAP